MTIRELKYILKVLEHINPQDEHIKKAIAFVCKDLAIYDARKGQLRDNYESDNWYANG